jgi:NAD-dependent deacetylase
VGHDSELFPASTTDLTQHNQSYLPIVEPTVQQVHELKNLLHHSHRTVVISGAGTSTESGIPDFRSENGFWDNEDLLGMMSDAYLHAHPEDFWVHFKKAFMNPDFMSAAPNEGHLALAEVAAVGKQVKIFTQNIDGLHQMAGSMNVYELHGNIRHAYCPKCHNRYGITHIVADEVPYCTYYDMKGNECGSVLHPDVVLFDQMVRHMDDAFDAVVRADLLLILGTSLSVEPVASLPQFISHGHKLAIVNLEPTYMDDRADLVIHASVGRTISRAVEELLTLPGY